MNTPRTAPRFSQVTDFVQNRYNDKNISVESAFGFNSIKYKFYDFLRVITFNSYNFMNGDVTEAINTTKFIQAAYQTLRDDEAGYLYKDHTTQKYSYLVLPDNSVNVMEKNSNSGEFIAIKKGIYSDICVISSHANGKCNGDIGLPLDMFDAIINDLQKLIKPTGSDPTKGYTFNRRSTLTRISQSPSHDANVQYIRDTISLIYVMSVNVIMSGHKHRIQNLNIRINTINALIGGIRESDLLPLQEILSHITSVTEEQYGPEIANTIKQLKH